MSDPRLTPDPARMGDARPAMVTVPVTDLFRSPNGPRDRQLIYGEALTLWSQDGTHSYVTADKDGYCGFVLNGVLDVPWEATHTIAKPATQAYMRAHLKSPDIASLSFGSRVTVIETTNNFAATPLGYIPLQHLLPVTHQATDPVAIAQLFLGTPYLWGGNSRFGIDCSGLVQAALLACGIPCPGDSDMQMALGATATPPFQRNDLLFWKGHVALVTDQCTIIHANAHAMAVTLDPIEAAITRIEENGDGPITAHRRLASIAI